ncbi:MAG: metallophosphoesterase [Bacillota bacterium]|nr:metallophosphoesterase [Bacillota bacterium]MDW7676888.1 metallophosphoesterase [Bacillota bacterium]
MIYTIGDLHLGSQVEKPMSVFGSNWNEHPQKMRDSWLSQVAPQDAVLIPGDISWAMTLEEAMPDLEWIDSLPGRKYLIKGNHDYWWKSIHKLNALSETMFFIQNHFFPYEGKAICGTRGWACPGTPGFTPQDQKIYLREAQRLELSLQAAKRAGHDHIIGMIHFPPANERKEPSLFTHLFETYGVTQVVYGHIHGEDSIQPGPIKWINGVYYQLVSSDFLKFEVTPLQKPAGT